MLSKKKSFLVIVIITSLLVGGLIGFYFYTQNKNKNTVVVKESGHANFANYNPDNQGTSTTDGYIIPDQKVPEDKVPKLRKISDVPVSGSDFVFIDTVATSSASKNIEPPDLSTLTKPLPKPKVKVITSEVIRFTERGNGNIYETSTSTTKNTRISNTTIPKIYETSFLNKGDSMILRDLIGSTDIIRTRYAELRYATTSDDSKSLVLTDLPVNILELAVSPSKTKIFSILKSGVTGLLSQVDGGSKVALFDSPIKEWLVSWPTDNDIILTTKASGYAPGYTYDLNVNTKSFSRIFGGMYGLTTLPSPDASKILFSQSTRGSFITGVYDRKTQNISYLPLNTLAEKCVWAKTEKDVVYCGVPSNIAFDVYPDVWYQGIITFSDTIWKNNLDTGESRVLVIPENESGEIIDSINPVIDSKDDYLLFTNKIDLSLWGLQLKEPAKPDAFNPLNNASSTGSSTKK